MTFQFSAPEAENPSQLPRLPITLGGRSQLTAYGPTPSRLFGQDRPSSVPDGRTQHVNAASPSDGRLNTRSGETILNDDYRGLAAWWKQAEAVWDAHKSSERLSLAERLNYMRGLTEQFPAQANRVVYTASGTYLSPARVTNPLAVIEHKLYWAATSGIKEGRYLRAILNSPVLTELVRPLQSVGAFGPPDFDKYVFRLTIPLYDPSNAEHERLVELAERAEEVARDLELPVGTDFRALRRRVRNALDRCGLGGAINELTAGWWLVLVTPEHEETPARSGP
jgi:hypothetical protein